MLTLFWDIHGPILVCFQAHGQTVNSANYRAMLQNELKPVICKKRRGMLSKKSYCIMMMNVLIQQQRQ